MGIAAYNRASAVVSRRIQESYPEESREMQILKMLNQHEPGEVELFAATIVRLGGFKENNSYGWYVMNRPGDWREYSVGPFPSLAHVAKRYSVYFLDIKRDKVGQYAVIAPRREYDEP